MKKLNNRSFFLLVALLLLSISVQPQRPISVYLGYGYFEGFHAGACYNLPMYDQHIGLSLGMADLFNFKNKYYAASADYSISIFRKKTNKSGSPKWHSGASMVLWQLEDKYYKWDVLSLVPFAGRAFALNKNISINTDAGIAFNLVLYNKRKTFEKAGWPYHVYPNLKIDLVF